MTALLKDMWAQISQYLYNGKELKCSDLPINSCKSTLASGESFDSSSELCSESKLTKLSITPMGVLIISTNTFPSYTLWSNNVEGAVKATMLQDGNFVLYNAKNEVVWSTNTAGFDEAILNINDDFNLYIEKNGQVVYTTNKYIQVTTTKNAEMTTPASKLTLLFFKHDGGLCESGERRV